MKIKDSFIKNPLPWVLLAGGGIYLLTRGVKAAKGLLSKGTEQKFETGSANNPFAFRAFFAAVPKGTSYTILTAASANSIAKSIYDSFGFFYDDEQKFKNAFRLLKTQAQVAQIAKVFSEKYGKDLLSYIKDGYGPLPSAGLSQSDYDDTLKLVSKLPKYK